MKVKSSTWWVRNWRYFRLLVCHHQCLSVSSSTACNSRHWYDSRRPTRCSRESFAGTTRRYGTSAGVSWRKVSTATVGLNHHFPPMPTVTCTNNPSAFSRPPSSSSHLPAAVTKNIELTTVHSRQRLAVETSCHIHCSSWSPKPLSDHTLQPAFHWHTEAHIKLFTGSVSAKNMTRPFLARKALSCYESWTENPDSCPTGLS